MAKYILTAITLLIFAIFGVFYGREKETVAPLDLPRASVTPAVPQVVVGKHTFRVDVADEPVERYQGLSGREKLDDGGGMLFIFEKPDLYGFWMKDMRFSIDIIWIKRGRVAGISEKLDPSSYPKLFYPPEPVDYVLEISSGEASRRGIKVGDTADLLINF